MLDNDIDPTDDQQEQAESDSQEVEEQGLDDHTTDAENAPEDEDGDTFSRDYVDKLRKENKNYRLRAKAADDLAARLHTELVRATGRLADPGDLQFDAAHLEDPDALTAAIEDLVESKPHLASRRPSGDIGQGSRESAPAPVSLSAMLRARA